MNVDKLFYSLFLLILFTTSNAFAAFEIGTAMNSLTAGRVIPGLELTYSAGDSVYTWSGSGVKNYYYYQNEHSYTKKIEEI